MRSQSQGEKNSPSLQPPCRKQEENSLPSGTIPPGTGTAGQSLPLQGLLFNVRRGCEGWWLQDPPRSMFSELMALPHIGPGRKRKGVRHPTQLPKEPPPLPLSSVSTPIFRTGSVSTSPAMLRAPGKNIAAPFIPLRQERTGNL